MWDMIYDTQIPFTNTIYMYNICIVKGLSWTMKGLSFLKTTYAGILLNI